MALFQLDPLASEAIRKSLSEKGLPLCVRIEVRSTGCCDASLGLAAEAPAADDLVEPTDGLTLSMSPATHELVGNVAISCVYEPGRVGFVLRSERPLNEWAGFAPGSIRLCDEV